MKILGTLVGSIGEIQKREGTEVRVILIDGFRRWVLCGVSREFMMVVHEHCIRGVGER